MQWCMKTRQMVFQRREVRIDDRASWEKCKCKLSEKFRAIWEPESTSQREQTHFKNNSTFINISVTHQNTSVKEHWCININTKEKSKMFLNGILLLLININEYPFKEEHKQFCIKIFMKQFTNEREESSSHGTQTTRFLFYNSLNNCKEKKVLKIFQQLTIYNLRSPASLLF